MPASVLRVLFQAALQQPGDGALGAADRAVQQQHAPLGAVALGGRLEGVHQLHQRPVEAVDARRRAGRRTR